MLRGAWILTGLYFSHFQFFGGSKELEYSRRINVKLFQYKKISNIGYYYFIESQQNSLFPGGGRIFPENNGEKSVKSVKIKKITGK